jgi:hypothetical protein
VTKKKPLTEEQRAMLRAKVTRALTERPQGEGLPLAQAARLLKQADQAGMTLPEWIALFKLRQ